MPYPRNSLTYLIIGAVLGGILGAVVGIAIGSTGRAAGPIRVQTVVSTRTVRVAGPALPVSPPLADIAPKGSTPDTTTTDTTANTTDTTTTDTTTTDTTTTDTTTTETTTRTTPDPNDVPPPDPNNPPAGFCVAHVCAPGFTRGNGFVVQCADGVWTRHGGQQGACRRDGGLA